MKKYLLPITIILIIILVAIFCFIGGLLEGMSYCMDQPSCQEPILSDDIQATKDHIKM